MSRSGDRRADVLPTRWNYWEYRNEDWATEGEAESDEIEFHGSENGCDYSIWGKKAYWSADEATALSFGKDPKKINWAHITEVLLAESAFTNFYTQLRNKILTAQAANELPESIPPRLYLDWAANNRLDVPAQFRSIIAERELEISELKDLCEKLKVKLDSLIRENQELRYRLEAKGTTITPAKTKSATAQQKEARSMLKLILGMAKDKYRYDPERNRNAATANICSALNTLGINIDQDTVKKYLDRASEMESEDSE